MSKDIKIKYPLDEEEKQGLRDRLDKVLSRKSGEQVIILWDKEKLTDYYQNICIKHLLKEIKESAEEFKKITKGELIT